MNSYTDRKNIRLPAYRYDEPGAYFITLVSYQRACLFGEIVGAEVKLGEVGKMVVYAWNELPASFRHLRLDAVVVMPNHFHAVLWIDDPGKKGRSATLGVIVGQFKEKVTRRARRYDPKAQIWQRNYYERIIRTEDELDRIRRYIEANPLQWAEDHENPDHH